MKIVQLTEGNLETLAVEAAGVLAKGGLVIYPTDTLYGIAANALDTDALARLRLVKGRERRKPISLVVPGVAHIDAHAELSEEARALAERHLPGALTLVVPAKPHLPEELMLNGTIGIRVPNDPFALALAQACAFPFTATSANKSGYQPPATVEGIIRQLNNDSMQIALAIDAGERAGGIPSTVVAYMGGSLCILREGALSGEELGI